MVNVWKIGSRPGLWEKRRENKVEKGRRFVHNYVLEYDFVAIGNAWVEGDFRVLIKQNRLREVMEKGWDEHKTEEGTKPKLDIREKMFRDFVGIKADDIILQYLERKDNDYGEVYVGKAILNDKEPTPYYYIDDPNKKIIEDTEGINYAPHRVKVTWDFHDNGIKFKKENSFPAKFDNRYLGRRIIPVKEDMLDNTILDEKLRQYLRKKLKEWTVTSITVKNDSNTNFSNGYLRLNIENPFTLLFQWVIIAESYLKSESENAVKNWSEKRKLIDEEWKHRK